MPQSQSFPIAYAVKRRNMKASGGMIQNEKLDPMHEAPHDAEDVLMKDGIAYLPASKLGLHMAAGGMMNPMSMAKAIRMKKMACGGMSGYADGGMTESEDQDWLSKDHDWLSSEPDADDDAEVYADGGMAMAEDDAMKKHKVLSKIMNGLSMKHMGK